MILGGSFRLQVGRQRNMAVGTLDEPLPVLHAALRAKHGSLLPEAMAQRLKPWAFDLL
jgi:hypothetical protein